LVKIMVDADLERHGLKNQGLHRGDYQGTSPDPSKFR